MPLFTHIKIIYRYSAVYLMAADGSGKTFDLALKHGGGERRGGRESVFGFKWAEPWPHFTCKWT